jgi:hypothetical protein
VIGPEEARFRCASNSCDDWVLCVACGDGSDQGPVAGGRRASCLRCRSRLYLDRASPLVLRARVFKEAFLPAAAVVAGTASPGETVVHPWVLAARAFDVYGERPLMGEPLGEPVAVRWWNYAQCGAAARGLAAELMQRVVVANARQPRATQGETKGAAEGHVAGSYPNQAVAVLLCARNGPGWLLADWACCLAALPTVAADASIPPAEALRLARAAAKGRRLRLGACVVDAERADEWQRLMRCRVDEGAGDADGVGVDGVGTAAASGDDADPAVSGAVFTTADAYARLLATASEAPRSAVDVAAVTAAAAAAAAAAVASVSSSSAEACCSALLLDPDSELMASAAPAACLLSFGSNGSPNPLWYDGRRWAEWAGAACPPPSRRDRQALIRRSTSVHPHPLLSTPPHPRPSIC